MRHGEARAEVVSDGRPSHFVGWFRPLAWVNGLIRVGAWKQVCASPSEADVSIFLNTYRGRGSKVILPAAEHPYVGPAPKRDKTE